MACETVSPSPGAFSLTAKLPESVEGAEEMSKSNRNDSTIPAGTETAPAGLLDPRAIRLKEHAADRDDAIRQCGQALVDVGAVDPSYIQAMLERERSVSTYVGEGVAIPHGTLASKESVGRDALSFLRFPQTVDWGGEPVTICIGIAARGGGHMGILAALAQVLTEPGKAQALRDADDPDEVVRLLQPEPDEEEASA
jgi:PTS system mannitol-specific IIA component